MKEELSRERERVDGLIQCLAVAKRGSQVGDDDDESSRHQRYFYINDIMGHLYNGPRGYEYEPVGVADLRQRSGCSKDYVKTSRFEDVSLSHILLSRND